MVLYQWESWQPTRSTSDLTTEYPREAPWKDVRGCASLFPKYARALQGINGYEVGPANIPGEREHGT